MPRDITYYCAEKKDIGRIEGLKGNSFKCELCGLKLMYIEKEKRLGAHGRTKETIGHELRQVNEPL